MASGLPSGMVKRGRVYWAWFRSGGQRVRQRLSTDYQTACSLLRDMRARADRRAAGVEPGDALLAEVFSRWLVWLGQHRKPGTIREYRRDVEAFLGWSSMRYCNQVTPDVIRDWRDHLARTGRRVGNDVKPITPRTINRRVAAVSAMLSWAADRRRGRMIAASPLAGLEPLPCDERVKQRRALEPDEVLRLIEHSEPRWATLWRLLASTGLRVTEALSLRRGDLDREGLTIHVRRAIAKSRKERAVAVDAETMAQLVALAGPVPDDCLVFRTSSGKPIARQNVRRQLVVCCQRARVRGGEYGGSVDVHSLRVTFATAAIVAGADPKSVQSQLGHTSLALTMGIYTRASETGRAAAVAGLPWVKGWSQHGHSPFRDPPSARENTAS